MSQGHPPHIDFTLFVEPFSLNIIVATPIDENNRIQPRANLRSLFPFGIDSILILLAADTDRRYFGRTLSPSLEVCDSYIPGDLADGMPLLP